MLALARTHADRRIAFHQLGRIEALLHGIGQILHLNIFVESHEIL